MLAGKGIVRAGHGNKKWKKMLRGGHGSKKPNLIPPHLLTSFEIQKYYKNKPTFNGVFSRDNVPKKIKD